MKNKILSAIVVCGSLLLVQGVDSTFRYTHGTSMKPSSRIIHGDNADPKDFLYVVQLYVEHHSNAVLCSGSIISKYFILTAAHCIYSLPCELIQIYSSTWIPGDVPKIHADHCRPHEQYKDGFYSYDIGLIQTKEDILASGELKFIPLPKPITEYQPDDYAIIVGWGMTEDNVNAGELILTNMRVDSWDHCNKEYQKASECADHMNCPVQNIPPHAMCTIGIGPKFASACVGDAGGPTIINGEVAAVVSGSIMLNDECELGTPSLLIKVTEFLPWINSVTRRSGDAS